MFGSPLVGTLAPGEPSHGAGSHLQGKPTLQWLPVPQVGTAGPALSGTTMSTGAEVCGFQAHFFVFFHLGRSVSFYFLGTSECQT